jgi:hypothetical protein
MFLVSIDNPFLVSTVLTDTIYTIQKMNDFWYRLFRTDINNINRANTQFLIRPSVVSALLLIQFNARSPYSLGGLAL